MRNKVKITLVFKKISNHFRMNIQFHGSQLEHLNRKRKSSDQNTPIKFQVIVIISVGILKEIDSFSKKYDE